MRPLERYTLDLTVEHMVLLEDHLEDYTARPTESCIECMYKHFSAIAGLASEGVKFFPKDKFLWIDLMAWARVQKRRLGSLSVDDAVLVLEELRRRRKKIEKLDEEVFGSCITCEALEEVKGKSHFHGGDYGSSKEAS